MGHLHTKVGMAGLQARVAEVSPPPPSITIQANIELDMKTTTEYQGVDTTSPAPLQITKLGSFSRSDGDKKVCVHVCACVCTRACECGVFLGQSLM